MKDLYISCRSYIFLLILVVAVLIYFELSQFLFFGNTCFGNTQLFGYLRRGVFFFLI